HRVQHPPVHRLQSVAHVGQGAPDDHRHGVVEVRRAHLLLERARLHVAAADHISRGHRSPPRKRLWAVCAQTSRLATARALSSMNARRGSTWSPISIEKMRSAAAASSSVTWASVRVEGDIVVSPSWSAFISPSPLKRCSLAPFWATLSTALRSASNEGAASTLSPRRTSKGGVPASSIS